MKDRGAIMGLEPLVVLDNLTVGPARVERRRISVPYVVRRGKATSACNLIYAWEEDVFEPGEPWAENLAAMIGAQVALNYGLFCKEIVFGGSLDEDDRRFLNSMAVNTAREIYVNKFLAPNPFLVGDVARLPVVRAQDYLLAELRYPDPPPAQPPAPWPSEPRRHAVLSSGGKDSLLSFGVLHELGLDVHALFVNESGRHWFTALNGFRALRAEHPLTARVWTNSDRVFSWMLRQLPFVRPDFGRVRADIYPVRLWSVAVFLFGVLPLMRKRGIGRLIIGDENDTSRRLNHEGIPHYGGLYDQSIWFDAALTRYFARKRWGVHQFSLLRSISELLIEKILVERYPKLLENQMSCHSAHPAHGRMWPCGRCEKCRRIVAMLVALGADPRVCGYSAEQVQRCLASLNDKGIHQEHEDVAGLQALLAQKDPARKAPASTGAAERLLPLYVKFDARRSPVDLVPDDLWPGVSRIYGQHALGTVIRNGRAWQTMEPQSAETK